jgi:hypothetical protein
MRQRILATLLHYANASPPTERTAFYDLKERLLQRYGTFRGHDLQEIRKPCWGWGWWRDDGGAKCGPKCFRCGGTGIFDLRWVRLERWEWMGYVFHRPAGDTRIKPEGHVAIQGRIEHPRYGRASSEAALWLYLLCGEWALLWRALRGSSCCGWYLWPLLNVQRVTMHAALWLSRQRCCFCGKTFFTWGSGWQVCKPCRDVPREIPF